MSLIQDFENLRVPYVHLNSKWKSVLETAADREKFELSKCIKKLVCNEQICICN